jgi:hypothetical protein
MFYFETASFSGHWTPQKSMIEPRVHSKQGKPDRVGNDIGPRIRGLAAAPP